ncbi:MAG: hypothetical protein AMXMBFR46_28550, partial [Acidimicrobiia bacterium]
TAASTSASSTVPATTASASAGPYARPGPGISRSSPAAIEVSVSATPNQSVITKPSKPHSPRTMSRRISACSITHPPFSRLYAVMSASAPPSRTASSNGNK